MLPRHWKAILVLALPVLGLFSSAAAAAPSITSLSVSSGPVGTSVTINGTSFGSPQGSSTVTFNGTTATATSWTSTSIAVTVPSAATTGNVIVTVSGVASNAKSFTVTPHIISLSITSGAVGASVTITGTTFGSTQGTSTIKFNTTTATPTTWTASSIVVPVPTGATTGNVVVTVSSQASNGVSFTVVAAPSITSLSASSGPVGTSVTITGTGFGSPQGTGSVTFNGTAATPTSWSATSIAVPVPSAATTGNVVVNASGVASNGKSFTVVPHIASLSITSGAVGASVTITGTTFGGTQGTSTIKFNTTTATPTSWGASSIVVPVPTGATTGNVVVTVSSQASNGVSFTVVAAPSITSLSVTSGPVGTAVTITGTGFGSPQGSGTVAFNGTAATPTSWTATSIAVTVPAAATTGNVVVQANGANSNGTNFTVTPHITSLSITSAAVGSSVTISGATFGGTQGSSTLTFNGTSATPTSWSASSVVVAVPTNATTGNIVVTVSSQPSNGVSFTVVPHITSLSPTSGAVTSSVTISGTTFGATQGSSTVTFNGTTATPTGWTASSIVVPVPSGATTGNVVVTVSSQASNGLTFTVLATPSITSLAPTSGSVGTPVTITGTNFGSTQGTSTVTFNGTAATPTSWSASSIVVPVPSGTTTGPVLVTIGGVPSNGSSFTMTSLPAGWTDADIGTVGAAGSASYANGVFTVSGAGNGINGTTDAFNFAYQPLSTSGTIVARLVSSTSYGSMAGIMVRQALNASSVDASLVYRGQDYLFLFDRPTSGGSTADPYYFAPPAIPYWIKLTYASGSLNGYTSRDGINWVPAGTTVAINFGASLYVGLAVTSASDPTISTATFDSVSISSSSNSAPAITGVSATTGSVGSQVVVSGSGFGSTQGNSVVLLNGAPLTINSWSGTSISTTIPAGATSGDLLVSVAPSMNDSNPVYFTITSNPLPAGWLDQDIGTLTTTGSATYANGVFTVNGAGVTIGSGSATTDEFHFVYQPMTGDGTVMARIISEQASGGQAGVMIRETMDSDATNAFTADVPSNPYVFLFDRPSTGASEANTTDSIGVSPPCWVKLVRSGTNFTAYRSSDGVNWVQVGWPQSINMASNVYVGLGVDSGDPGSVSATMFDNVSITSTATPGPVITSVSATTGPVGGQVTINGTGFGATQGNSLVSLSDVPVNINSWSASSISITIPTGAISGYLVVSVGPDFNDSNPVTFIVTSQFLPAPWLDQDVGAVGNPGSPSYAGGVYTVQGAGTGIGATTDGFNFVYQPLTTNGAIVARVTNVQGSWGSQAGVMIRESLAPYSPEVSSLAVATNQVNLYEDYRTLSGAATSVTSPQNNVVTLPYWVQVVRTANMLTAFVSPDGNTWTQVGTPQSISTAETVYAGLAIASGVTNVSATGTFDNVSISAGTSLPNPVVTGVSPTTGEIGTSVTINGSGFGATQGVTTGTCNNTVCFNGGPATTITSWSDSQIVAIVPATAATGPVSVTVGNITGTGPTFTLKFVVQLTDSLGNVSTYTSAPSGGLWTMTDLQGSGCSSCSSRGNIHNQFDSNGHAIWTTDALGNSTSYRYDASSDVIEQLKQLNTTTNVTNKYAYNGFGEVLNATDALNNVTQNSYDGHGNLLSVTTPLNSLTQFAYNALGELTQITDPLGNVTTLTYTSVGLIATIKDAQNNVTTYGYDAHGNRTSVTDALTHQTTFAYDAGDRLTMITYPDSTTTTFAYDYRGRRTSVTDQNGKTTSYAYDDADRLTTVTDAATHVTTYAYDTENNLLSITDANNHETSFSYDAYGRVMQTNFPSSLIETYTYDANNNLTSKTDRKSQTIGYVYDALNRLTQKNYPDSTSVEYVYDLVGKIQSVNDPTGTYAFAYDNDGRLIGTTTSYSFLSGRNFTTSVGYDAASNRNSFTDPESGSTAYVYDTLNRLTTLTPPSAFTSGGFGFSYDALSRRTQMTRPNNVTTNYTYDNLSRLLTVLHQLSGSTIDGASYTVDNAGNRTAKTDQRAAVTSNYGYDAIYQLLSTMQSGSTTESYSYDPVGNRTASLGASSYSNNSSNELTSTSTGNYTYDANGNRLTSVISSNTTTYVWDFENRLTSVTLPGAGGTVSFKYDSFGRRIYKSSSAGTSVYAYDGDNLIEETNSSGAVVVRYSQGQNIDEPLAMLRSSTTSYYDADGLGSITSLSNSAGSVAETYGYDSFGKQTSASGSLTNPFQYTARESDTETGLYYYRARYYAPDSGKFLSEDPIQFSGGVDFYAYANNNATLLTDPSGYCPDGYRPLNDDERQRLVNAGLSNDWNGWGFDPNLKIDLKNKRIGCSGFVFLNLQHAKIKVPWTSAFNINKGAPNYYPIKPKDLKPGDLLQFDTDGAHLAIATSADPFNGYNFVGSQTSTGPRQVKNWTNIPYWAGRIAGYYQICLPSN
jgi:RHS repeat-associated protein